MLGKCSYHRWLHALAVLVGVFTLLTGPLTAQEADPCRLELGRAALEPFEQSGKYGYRMADGVTVIEPIYAHAMAFSIEGIAAVVDQDGWVYIDRTGKQLLRPHVVDNGPDYFREGLARFVSHGKFGFMDTRARIAIKATFAYAEPFERGYALICEDCHLQRSGEHAMMEGIRWGVIDIRGKVVVAPDLERDQARAAAQRLNGGG